jgi:uncharacterized protein
MATSEPTTDNGRLINSAYEAFARGDVPYVVSLLAEDVEWIETDAAEIPFTGTSHSPQQVVDSVFMKMPEYFETFELRPESWIESGEDVVATGRVVARLKNGQELDAPFAHVFTVKDGKVTRNEVHNDTARWLEVL